MDNVCYRKPKYYIYPGCNNDKRLTENILKLGPSEIIGAIASYFDVDPSEIRGKKRFRKFAYPRHVCVYFMKKYGLISSSQIGRIFNRDHTTILHSLDTVKNWRETNDEMMDKINDLKNIFCG